MKKWLIIGSAGQVGQEFVKHALADKIVPLTRQDVDVTNAESVCACFDKHDFDTVINLAAFHDVNGCEEDEPKAFASNSIGAHHVARAAASRNAKAVFFSSDYVFGLQGDRNKPYLEDDVIGPLNVYGASKAAGEQLVRTATDNHMIIRASSLFGVVTSKKGWTFPEMILARAREGKPLKVVNDQYMSPTYTLDLVQTVMALVNANATGTVHVSNADGCTWYDFAKATLEITGVDHPIEPVDSSAFPSKAQRPAYSRLDSERLASLSIVEPRHWRDALHAYLVEKGEI